MRILVADDNEITVFKLTELLSELHYEVIVARDGEEAWKQMSDDDAPKIALLDWRMPGRDGVTICQMIRQQRRSIAPYIILLTGNDDKRDIIKGLEAGADDYVTKPYDIDILKVRIKAGERVINLQSELSDRIEALNQSVKHIERLQGIIPICMYCKRIRNDKESWDQIDQYITEHSNAQFSHSMCPECYETHIDSIVGKEPEC